LLSGMGELHLEILVDRLLREYKVKANVGKPQVSFRETINQAAKGSGTFEKEIGGVIQFGHCVLEISPQDRGEGIAFVNSFTGELPAEFLKAIEQGAREASDVGILAGYQMMDIKITLLKAELREEESTSMAFKVAAAQALREAAQKAGGKLLEPIFKLEILTPEDYMGNVIGDLNSRRGKVNSMTPKGGSQVIDAEAPLMTLFGYATDIRSVSQGRATFSMEFDRYEEVPGKVEKEILQKIGR